MFYDQQNLFCIHHKALEFEIFGTETTAVDFSVLDVMLVPCASRITFFDGSVIGGDDSCVWEEYDIEEYMGNSFDMFTYHSQQ